VVVVRVMYGSSTEADLSRLDRFNSMIEKEQYNVDSDSQTVLELTMYER